MLTGCIFGFETGTTAHTNRNQVIFEGQSAVLDGGSSTLGSKAHAITEYRWVEWEEGEATGKVYCANSLICEIDDLTQGKHLAHLSLTDDSAKSGMGTFVTIYVNPPLTIEQNLTYPNFETFLEPETARTYTSDDKKEIVIDETNALIWQNPIEEKGYHDITIEDGYYADTYCKDLSWAGSTEWRLPTIEELIYLSFKKDDIPHTLFQDLGTYHWSSTSYEEANSSAWMIDLYSTETMWVDKNSLAYVNCVRMR